MKVEDLVIGDWIYVNPWDDQEPTYPNRVTGIHYNSWRGADYCDWVDCEVWDEIGLDEIRPIPLTAEILEANKMRPFEIDRLTDKATKKWWAQKGEFYVKQYHFRHHNFEPEYSIGCHSHTLIEGIHYIHELQHALRLCGIEKEIKINV